MIFFPPLFNRSKFGRRNKTSFYYQLPPPRRQEVLILSGCWSPGVYKEHIPLKLTYSLSHFFFYKTKHILNKNLLVTRRGSLRQPWMLILFLFIPFTSFGSHENHGVERTTFLRKQLDLFSQKWVSRIDYDPVHLLCHNALQNTPQNKVLTFSDVFSGFCISDGGKDNKEWKAWSTFIYYWLRVCLTLNKKPISHGIKWCLVAKTEEGENVVLLYSGRVSLSLTLWNQRDNRNMMGHKE